MRQLLLMRHAKSDWDADYEEDHERPLNDRGVRSAKLMGRLLSGSELIPGMVISSTAVRARTTAQLAGEAGGWDTPIRLERDLYDMGPVGVISLASGAPDAERLMLVGHQPTWGLLVEAITGEIAEMKTATVAVIDLQVETWADLPGAKGRLVAVHQPREHFRTELDRP